MENSLELFHPKKSELIEMTAKYSALTISGINDREGYKAVHDARMVLVKARTGIKEERLKFTRPLDEKKKQAIELEEELIGIISPLEKSLEAKETAIDREKERIKAEKERVRQELLENSIRELAKYGYVHPIADLMEMKTIDFMDLLEEKKLAWKTAEKARIDRETAERLEREEFAKKKAEQDAREKEIADREAAMLAKEREAERKMEEEIAKVELENYAREAAERAEKETEERIKNEQLHREALEAHNRLMEKQAEEMAKAKVERNRRYKAWLSENGYGPADEVEKSEDGTKYVLWRQISVFEI